MNDKLKDYYNKKTSDEKYVPYSGAINDVNLGDHTLTVSDGQIINPTETVIDKGNITLSGKTIIPGTPGIVERSVNINVDGITVGNTTYGYPEGASSPLATEKFVSDTYQTETQVNSLIDQTPLTFGGGDISGRGLIGDQEITLDLNEQGKLPDDDKYRTFSAVHVNKKGIVTSGAQQIVFASTINDSALSNLVIGGVAIIDA